jgi:apolipoprotein N-acyltransferase
MSDAMHLSALRAFPLAFLLGAVAACGFAPLNLWPLTFLCLAGLILLVRQARTGRRAAAIGWWFGLGNFCIGLNWIATAFTFQAAMPAWLGWIAVLLLSLYLAIYPALASATAWWIARPKPPSCESRDLALVLAFAGAWTVSEWLRATLFTGFAWNPIGVAWVTLTPIARIGRFVGTYGLSGVAMLAGGGIAMAILTARRARRDGRTGKVVLLIGIPAAVMIALAPAIVFDRFSRMPPAADAPLLRVVQPNIGQDVKWDADHVESNFAKLEALSGKPGPRPRLVIWPEAAVPFFLEENAGARTAIASLLGPRDIILTGADAVQYGPDGAIVSAANSVFGMDANGRLLGRYDKAHLVPYGEYLPMRPILSAIGLSRLVPGRFRFRPGEGAGGTPLPGAFGDVGLQICYEIIFSGQVVDRAPSPRSSSSTPRTTAGSALGPAQHLAQARLRAIEEGLPIIRAPRPVSPRSSTPMAACWQRCRRTSPGPSRCRSRPPMRHAFRRIGNAHAFILATVAAVRRPLPFRRWALRPSYKESFICGVSGAQPDAIAIIFSRPNRVRRSSRQGRRPDFSDSVVDLFLSKDPEARVACETLTTTNWSCWPAKSAARASTRMANGRRARSKRSRPPSARRSSESVTSRTSFHWKTFASRIACTASRRTSRWASMKAATRTKAPATRASCSVTRPTRPPI